MESKPSPRTSMKQFLSSFPPPPVLPKGKRGKPAKSVKQTKPASKANKPYKKKKIPAALREAVWIKTMGKVFEGKCPIPWCFNSITVFDFQAGHNIPESKGGETKLPNLIAICSRCNTSMGNTYTIDEWSAMHSKSEAPKEFIAPKRLPWWKKFLCCFSRQK